MKDIIKLYSYYTLNFPENKKSIKLTYKITEYQFIKNQCKNKIKRLKKSGYKVRLIKGEDGNKYYYKLYSEKTLSSNQKKNVILSILKIKNSLNQTLEQEILKKLYEINCHKKTSDKLMDTESKMLDILCDFLLAENDDNLYTNYKLDKIQKKEVPIIDGEIMNDKYRENKKITKTQESRWKDSKTYRMNMIFNYDKSQETIKNNSIWNNTQVKNNEDDMYIRSGLINKYDIYKSHWCDVDTENSFIFYDEIYQIDNIDQYKPRKPTNRDYFKLDYDMDKILVFEQYGNLYFFDMNICQIDNKYIKKC